MTLCHQNRNRDTDQWNKIENLGIDPTTDFWKRYKSNSIEKLNIHGQEKKKKKKEEDSQPKTHRLCQN